MRETLNTQLKTAMKDGDKRRVATIRLVNATLKDRDIEARGQGKSVSDQDILAILQKMVKSRQESLDIYSKAGRDDLALGGARGDRGHPGVFAAAAGRSRDGAPRSPPPSPKRMYIAS